MDNTQILEPAFHVIPVPASGAEVEMPPAKAAKGFFSDSIPAAVSFLAFGLLERAHLCSAPRILSACCLAGELPGADG